MFWGHRGRHRIVVGLLLTWRGVLDTTLCDKVICDRSVVFSGHPRFLHQ